MDEGVYHVAQNAYWRRFDLLPGLGEAAARLRNDTFIQQ